MRIILLILILVVVAIIVAVATNLVDISQTRSARAPDIETGEGIRASGGQTPAFDIETGSLSVSAGQENVTVPVPRVDINPANEAGVANTQQPVANSQ